jgi:hypothetical protein
MLRLPLLLRMAFNFSLIEQFLVAAPAGFLEQLANKRQPGSPGDNHRHAA